MYLAMLSDYVILIDILLVNHGILLLNVRFSCHCTRWVIEVSGGISEGVL